MKTGGTIFDLTYFLSDLGMLLLINDVLLIRKDEVAFLYALNTVNKFKNLSVLFYTMLGIT